ncbi:MAG TPA: AraC family transcriptional regulator [Myxococcaceae bacterium]|jgi:AraC-like DNA-binding protein/mannose-6-phosphate isomerase-like protein (cupin superfamily)
MLAFSPQDPAAPRVEVQRLHGQHPLKGYEPHGHRFYELMFLERGRGHHRVGGRRAEVRAGDVLVIAPGEVHDARGMAEADGWLLLFEAAALDPSRTDAQVFTALPELVLWGFVRPSGRDGGHFHVPPPERARWSARFADLHAELARPRLGYEVSARALLTLILIDAARLAAESDRLSKVPPGSRPLLAQVFQLIESRYHRPISLQDVAKEVGRSPAHLTTLVKRQTGRSVLEWIIERRMAEARRLLVETELEVGEIGQKVSYLDPGYFIRQFRRANGVTPLQWRRARR